MSQDAINLIAHQRELETLFNKNQTITRIKSEFLNCKEFNFAEYMEAQDIPTGFGMDVLVQMALHKRCQLPTLVLLKVVRISSWEKAKANLITLAATLPEGTVQRKEFEDVIEQLVEHVESNNLQK